GELPSALEQVLTLRPVRLQTSEHQLADRNTPLPSALASVDAQQPLGTIEMLDIQSLELSAPQSSPVQQREHCDPQIAAEAAAPLARLCPQRLHVCPIDPPRQAAVRGDLRALHPAQRVLHPHPLAHQVLPESAHRRERPVHRRLRPKRRAALDVAHVELCIDRLELRTWAAALEPT